jgi:hypothetical protein
MCDINALVTSDCDCSTLSPSRYCRLSSVLSSEISVIHPRRGGSRSERRGVALRPDKIQQFNTISSKENFKNVLKIIITK